MLDESRAAGTVEPSRSVLDLESELDSAVSDFAGTPQESWSFRNDFFPAMAREFPGLVLCRDALLSAGCSFVSMSGSGSCMFGIFNNAGKATKAMKELSTDFDPILTFPLARLSDSI